MPELDRNLTLSAHRGTNTYLGVTVFPPKYAPLDTAMTKQPTKNGSQLLQLRRGMGLYIVHGRLRGDFYGRHTYSKCLGSSTVDDFITDSPSAH
jgi:hypothetical protein